jgi:ATP-dependent DNA helicase RecG
MSRPMPIQSTLLPDTPVNYVKGVGPSRGSFLASQGLRTVRDLIYWFPLRYEDRRQVVAIRDLAGVDRPVTVYGRVVSARAKRSPVRRVELFEAVLDDGTGALQLVWFHQPWVVNSIRKGDRISVFGLPKVTNYRQIKMDNPEFEVLEGEGEASWDGAVVPVYQAIGTITSKQMRRLVFQAMDALPNLGDPLPEPIRAALGVMPLQEALSGLHFPANVDEACLARRSEPHRRIISEEFFGFQLYLRARRAVGVERRKPRELIIDDRIRDKVRSVLPFRLTAAQKRVAKEIVDDLRAAEPMYRLLQGDVGCGKTIVALVAAIVVVENGFQVALLAPTEILAEQHYERIRQLVDESGIVVEKLTGSMPAPDKRAILERVRDGRTQILIGTHAIIEDRVEFRQLGFAIVDEQHRFGVLQRQKLFRKGDSVDILVMTATPIPRSLALAAYGDLELSVIDELPPGRQAVRTLVRGRGRLPKIWEFVEEKIAEGAQVYVVYPLIEESERVDLADLTRGVEEVRQALPRRRVEMLHGRMPAADKHDVMQRFLAGAIDVLVSTTVIEVGVDVPRASIMVVMDADRFGLSQLHQLRGRVGRGSDKSYCVVVRDERASEEAKDRLRAFERHADGFAIAEQDLAMRGAGDFLGTRQAGMPRFRFGDLFRDQEIMAAARDAAIDFVAEHGPDRALELARELLPASFAVTIPD